VVSVEEGSERIAIARGGSANEIELIVFMYRLYRGRRPFPYAHPGVPPMRVVPSVSASSASDLTGDAERRSKKSSVRPVGFSNPAAM
jgi:hypothetical protein